MKKIHFEGPLRWERGHGTVIKVGPGYAVCVSGKRAYAIRRERRSTQDRTEVTCKQCLAILAWADAS